jgi:hypothetical protein
LGLKDLEYGFYEWLIIIIFVIVVGIFIFTALTRWIFELERLWHNQEKEKLKNKIESLISKANQGDFNKELASFTSYCKPKLKKKRYYYLIEEIFFEIVEQEKEKSDVARIIAYELELPQRTIKNLKTKDTSSILRGCFEAKTYLYEPAIPYLLFHLKNKVHLQYDILLALTRFDDPEMIYQAFNSIKDSLHVNERTLQEIINLMSPESRLVFYNRILNGDSSALITMFLKCIDKETALAFKDRILELYTEDNPHEMRIASIKAISAAEDHSLIPEMISALQDPDWQMRAVAAKGLESIPDERARQPLITAICDSKWWVRQNAALALLAFPDLESVITDVLKTKDRFAIESLQYNAEAKNLNSLVERLQEALEKEP